MARPVLRLGLDLDGVFANFNDSFAPELVKVTGRDLIPNPLIPTDWTWFYTLGYRKSEVQATWDAIDRQGFWWAELGAVCGEQRTRNFFRILSGLIDAGSLNVFFMTSRPSRTAHWQSVDWLERHGLKRPQVLIANSAEDKGTFARILGLHAILDDYPPNLDAIRLACPTAVNILVEAPYNVDRRSDFITVPQDTERYLTLIMDWLKAMRNGETLPSFTSAGSDAAAHPQES